jgi:hypothetical protein
MADSSNTVFDPEVLKALAAAYDDACAALHNINRTDPRRMIVAKKITDHARFGERDPLGLREAVLNELQNGVDMGVIRAPPSCATTGCVKAPGRGALARMNCQGSLLRRATRLASVALRTESGSQRRSSPFSSIRSNVAA